MTENLPALLRAAAQTREAPSPDQLGHQPERGWHWIAVEGGAVPSEGDRILWPVISPEEMRYARTYVEPSPTEED